MFKDQGSLVVEGKRIFSDKFVFGDIDSLKQKLKNMLGKNVERLVIQTDIHVGYDEFFVIFEGGLVFKCLLKEGVQVSDLVSVPQEVRR